MCTTYILYSKSLDRFYVGHTCDEMNERLRKHNSNHEGYTGKTDDWRVVYTKEFNDKSTAYGREREIKNRKSRKYVESLIESAG
ncbi:MAG: GIY-YIG nuclease family protein [Nonlabens sp.]